MERKKEDTKEKELFVGSTVKEKHGFKINSK